MYVSGHPLDGAKEMIERVSSAAVIDILDDENNRYPADARVKIGGMIAKRREQLTRRGELMQYLEFEDMSGEI